MACKNSKMNMDVNKITYTYNDACEIQYYLKRHITCNICDKRLKYSIVVTSKLINLMLFDENITYFITKQNQEKK